MERPLRINRFAVPLLATAVFFLFLAFSSASSDDSIAGCGGFVRLSKELQSKGSKSKLPYESVHVELVSVDGELVKERAECAPNGYYFLPIYDKGSFNMRVHGPKGWNFEPSSVLIDEGRCDPSRDYNFVVTGFVLSGTVRSLGQSSEEGQQQGPAGVTVTLKNKANAKVADQTATTGQDGAFRFDNVFPGTYEIVASHPSWTFVKDRTEVSFEWDNVEVKDELLVGGFEVSGAVQSVEENAAVPGVDFILYSASDLKGLPVSCSTDGVSGAPEEKGMKAVCGARSDAAGKFVIKGVPCGKYTLVPHYRSSNTNYDLLPSRMEVTVSHANTEVSEPFRVAGFSVEGRVVDVDGEGISGATVLFDGVEKATTDANGHYRVEKVRVGSYAVEVVKDHVFFDSLKGVQLSPSKAQVPQIKAASYHLCGRVSLSSGRAEEKQKPGHRDVLLTDAVSGREERRSTDPTGAFCFEVAPGRYRVSPVISAAEERAGLLFVPAKREVTLNKSPVLDVNFGQALVTVQGVVRCLEAPCDPSISITLTGVDIESRVTASLSPSEKQEATYAIRDVLPGQYEVQIKHESWCWKQSTHKLDVKAEAETGKSHIQAPEFVHEGYQLSSVVSHDVKLVASLDSAPAQRQTFELTKGTNRFCLNKPGIYTLAPVSCYKFERDTYKYDTANPRLLDLQATHYLLNASVLAAQPAANITLHVAVDHSQKVGGRKDAAHEEYHASTTGEAKKQGDQYKYDYAIWVAPGDKLVLTPKAPAGSDLLFYPASTTFTLSKPECPSPLAPLQGRPGSYVKGRVEPALANVRISVYATNEEDGERRLVAESTTAPSGNYSIGPLPDNTPYEIEAVHEGYYFKQTETGVFQTQKLGTVAVTVKDEAGKPLQGVVISLSGEGYRSNNPTNQQGVFTVSALHPGSYYVRPLLKEYVFQPSATSVEVKEGQDERVTVSAKRVAYSCFGKVRSLSGEAEKFVPVEAVSATGEVEETQTDAEGNFRLRGLQPGKEYRIRVKSTDQRIERASPANGYLVKLAANEGLKDVQNQDFLVFRRLPKTDLTGEVNAESHVLSTLKVEVFEDGKSEVVKSVSLGPSTFFNVGPLDRDAKYRVRVSSSLSSRAYSHAPQEVSVELDSPRHLRFNFTATVHDPLRHDLTSTPIFSFILAVVLVALVYYHKLALEVGKAALSGDINAVRGLLRPKADEEEDSATSFLSPHHLHPAKVGRAGSRKNAARPGNRPSRS